MISVLQTGLQHYGITVTTQSLPLSFHNSFLTPAHHECPTNTLQCMYFQITAKSTVSIKKNCAADAQKHNG